jgi:hypothetical protein
MLKAAATGGVPQVNPSPGTAKGAQYAEFVNL